MLPRKIRFCILTMHVLILHWERLEQPPYSLDISPYDFFIYGYEKSKLHSYHCNSIYDLNKAIIDVCQKIPKIFVKMFMKAGFVALRLCMNATGTIHIHINISNKTIAYSLRYWLVSYFLDTLFIPTVYF